MKKVQSKIIEYDASKTIRQCLKKNAMAQSDVYLEEGGAVSRFADCKKEKWQGAFKVIYDDVSTVLVGNLGSILNIQKVGRDCAIGGEI